MTALATVPDTRQANGRFGPGNTAAMTHGKRRRKALLAPESTELYQDWASDLGGDPSAAERALLRRAAEAELLCQSAYHYIAQSRESIASRRMQAAFNVLSINANTVLRVAGLLGLKRRQRTVDPLQAVRDAVARANAKVGGQ